MTFKEYLIDAVGEQQAELIINNPDATFVIEEDRIPATGKTMLRNLLRDKGYSVVEEWELERQKIINLSVRRKEPIPEKERLDFLGIVSKIEDSGVDI